MKILDKKEDIPKIKKNKVVLLPVIEQKVAEERKFDEGLDTVIDKITDNNGNTFIKQAVKKNVRIGGKIRKPRRKINHAFDPPKMDTILELEEETVDMGANLDIF